MFYLKLIGIFVLFILVVKYWRQIKDISAAILVFITATIFIFTMYLHHLISTWHMLKKKK